MVRKKIIIDPSTYSMERVNSNIEWGKRNPFLVSCLEKHGLYDWARMEIHGYMGTEKEPNAIAALLDSLKLAPDDKSRRMIIDMLLKSTTTIPISGLVEVFNSSSRRMCGDNVIHAIALVGGEGSEDFLMELILSDPPNYFSKIAAFYASDTKYGKNFLPILREKYALFPFHALHTFYNFGEEEDIEFLKSQRGKTYKIEERDQKEYFKWLEKAISKLERKHRRKK